MKPGEYRLKWSTGHAYKGHTVTIPEDVVRLDEHEPCFRCGTRAGLPCKHRRLAA